MCHVSHQVRLQGVDVARNSPRFRPKGSHPPRKQKKGNPRAHDHPKKSGRLHALCFSNENAYSQMERTLTILKPDCVRKQLIGAVIDKIERAGFRVVAMKKIKLTQETAGEFYAVHRERPFYGELVDFMSSGPCVPIILEKENAVADFRVLIGATDPAQADEGTVRKLYADSKGENIVHGSDSVENAAIEAGFFFSAEEVVRSN